MFRMTPEAVVSFLGQTSLLRPCGTAVLAKLAPRLEQGEVPRGEALLRAGVLRPSVGFLVAGRASIRCKDPAQKLMARKLLAPSDAVHIVAE